MWCAVRVDRALSGLPGVVETEVNFERGEVRVEYDADHVDVESIKEQLDRAGYPPRITVPRRPRAAPVSEPDEDRVGEVRCGPRVRIAVPGLEEPRVSGHCRHAARRLRDGGRIDHHVVPAGGA